MSQRSRALFLPLAAVLAVATACDREPPTGAGSVPPFLPPDSKVAAPTFGAPLATLSAAELALFNAGKLEFAAVEAVDDGLGPVFNEASCATCHNGPVGGTTGRKETRFGRVVNGAFDPLAELGGSLLQDHAIGTDNPDHFPFVPEVVPSQADVTALRITTPLFGLGLVDAVPDEEFLRLARLEAATSPATAISSPGTPT
ncbi:MAG: hypothetical protein AUH42_06365 [Gemmatimonadetes bacterium 13_1_40CM_70_11]|nr:MAG: hypothetical protein AUH42_06365 [Gemmatimonadetes bacterium 13_1_40CM_70_11]